MFILISSSSLSLSAGYENLLEIRRDFLLKDVFEDEVSDDDILDYELDDDVFGDAFEQRN
ncbi:hypothetical protein N7540_000614 [Penicillium herquei]|nr:hypothetical protein N7540_000614 [Penicillium herquei]